MTKAKYRFTYEVGGYLGYVGKPAPWISVRLTRYGATADAYTVEDMERIAARQEGVSHAITPREYGVLRRSAIRRYEKKTGKPPTKKQLAHWHRNIRVTERGGMDIFMWGMPANRNFEVVEM